MLTQTIRNTILLMLISTAAVAQTIPQLPPPMPVGPCGYFACPPVPGPPNGPCGLPVCPVKPIQLIPVPVPAKPVPATPKGN